MESLYREDLAYIQTVAFGEFAQRAAPEIIRLLRSARISIRRVVDLGCGAGVLASALIEAGFEVTGVDDSAHLVATAAANVRGARFVKASIYEFDIPECEAIVALGESLSYHTEIPEADHSVWNFFQRAGRILPYGGLLIFDVIETGQPTLAGRTWRSGADWAVLAETTEDQLSRTLVRIIETFRQVGDLYRRGQEVHRIRLFDTNEVTAALAEHGFATETVRAYGSERLLPRRQAFICTRTKSPSDDHAQHGNQIERQSNRTFHVPLR